MNYKVDFGQFYSLLSKEKRKNPANSLDNLESPDLNTSSSVLKLVENIPKKITLYESDKKYLSYKDTFSIINVEDDGSTIEVRTSDVCELGKGKKN